ncbi:hypothetical protein [uncultured Tenacibaculum sp.]|uniref:hypothetical protein n=1 Tax=uncultured Tenacibaculum sp. TaxID=174713 RepID=UPI002628F3A7|nr:hypothetical protein [uncultured Tenacibaculum sp.]
MLENLKQFEIEKEQLVTIYGGINGGGGDGGNTGGDRSGGGGGTSGDGDLYCDDAIQIC